MLSVRYSCSTAALGCGRSMGILPKLFSLFLFCGVAALAGCGSPKQPFVTPERLERGLVLVLPGIEGRSYLNEHICQGLSAGGVNWAIEIFDWTSKYGPLYNQRAQETNRRKARDIASRIERYGLAFPDRPVMLVGHSGGGAMAVWTTEALGPEQTIEGAVLINPSLSPQYPLGEALGKTQRGIVLLYSPKDWVLLGIGTRVYGTMDGLHSVSAGYVGFEIPTDRPRIYRKLYQIGWTKDMARAGNTGSHLSSAAARFVSRYVAPLVLAKKWSKNYMTRVKAQDMIHTTGSPSESPE